jgi:hypothetical protein
LPWDGDATVADFGISRVEARACAPRKSVCRYLTPEEARGERGGAPSDVYSACLVVRQMLAFEPAGTRGSAPDADLLELMAFPRLRPLHALCPDLPAGLRDALGRGLDPDAGKRPGAYEMFAVVRGAIRSEHARGALMQSLARARGLAEPSVGDSEKPPASEPSVPPATVSLPPASKKAAPKRRIAWPFALALATALAALVRFDAAPSARARAVREKAALAAKWTEVKEKTSATGGRLFTASGAADRPVFVDGRYMGNLGVHGLAVPCGLHMLRVGGAKERAALVPCGGAVVVK